MTHSSELTSAAYLAGELSASERKDLEDHLLACDDCWADVEGARRGLVAVESLRELAPPHVRAAVRQIATGTTARPRARRHRFVLAAAAGVALLAGTAASLVVARRPAESGIIRAAVAGYMDDELPGSATPKTPGPDLSQLRMTDIGAGSGRLDGVLVTAYAYRDETGRRLMVYVGATAFPTPPRAHLFNGSEGPWMTHRNGVAVLGSRRPHTLLIVGEDDDLVHDAAVALDVM